MNIPPPPPCQPTPEYLAQAIVRDISAGISHLNENLHSKYAAESVNTVSVILWLKQLSVNDVSWLGNLMLSPSLDQPDRICALTAYLLSRGAPSPIFECAYTVSKQLSVGRRAHALRAYWVLVPIIKHKWCRNHRPSEIGLLFELMVDIVENLNAAEYDELSNITKSRNVTAEDVCTFFLRYATGEVFDTIETAITRLLPNDVIKNQQEHTT